MDQLLNARGAAERGAAPSASRVARPPPASRRALSGHHHAARRRDRGHARDLPRPRDNPVTGPGDLQLVYPKWLSGYHAPQTPVELFAGLRITASGEPLRSIRHPVSINVFHLDIPVGVDAIEVEFQFLSPTDPAQGRVLCSEAMLCLPWNTVLLHPAGYFARQITVEASLTLPSGWDLACALARIGTDQQTHRFEPVPLDVLVDSPVLAGAHLHRVALDTNVHLTLIGDEPDLFRPTPEQIAPHPVRWWNKPTGCWVSAISIGSRCWSG